MMIDLSQPKIHFDLACHYIHILTIYMNIRACPKSVVYEEIPTK
jgi:hypothetical protein